MSLAYFVKNKYLLTLGIAETVSGVGSWITMMAVYSILIFKQGGGVWQSSGIMLAGLLPLLMFSALAGKLADRFNKKYLMIASELLSGAVILAIFVSRQPGLILFLLALQATVSAIMGPARQSLIPALVTNPDELTRANAFLQQLASFVKIGAPMLAGLVIALMGPYNAMIFDVISFGLSALILLRLPNIGAVQVEPEVTASDTHPTAAATFKPLAVIKQSPGLRLLFAATFLMIISVMAFDILGSICTRDILRGDESLFGLLIGLTGLGTVLSGFYLMLRQKTVDPWQDFKLGVGLLMFLPGLLAVVSLLESSPFSLGLVIVGVLVGGIGVGFFMVQTSTLLQTLSPGPILGSISGYYQTVCVAGQLIAIVGVPLVVPQVVGITALFLLITASLGGVVIYTAFSLAAMQRRQFTGAQA
jgi:MFS family permease